ncbi:MAG: tetratricopeptide repeat protein [Planctomycetota bacterium]
MSDPKVLEVTARRFEADVVERSRTVPILLDFWAEWCGPCRTLGPVLEKLAEDYAGAFLLGKVDTEKERELAYAFGVQGIPFCVLMVDGQPVDAFTGALPEAEVKRFLARAGIEPAAVAAPLVTIDADAPAERWTAALAAVRKGDAARARERLSGIPEEHELHGAATRLRDGLDAFEVPPEPQGSPAAQAILRGRGALRAGSLDDAMSAFIESITKDRSFGNGLARRHAVLVMELLGATPEGEDRVAAYRRRLATLLF